MIEGLSLYLILYSGVIKKDSFLSLLTGIGSLIIVKVLIKPISHNKDNFIVGTFYFLFMHAVTIIIPIIIYVVAKSIFAIKDGFQLNSFGVILHRLLLLSVFTGLFEENLRKVFFNRIYVKYYVKRNSYLWITFLSVLFSFFVHITGFRLIFAAFPNTKLVLFIAIIEIYLSLFYIRGSIGSDVSMDTEASTICRIFFSILLYSPFCILQDANIEILAQQKPILYISAVVTCTILIYIIAKRKDYDTRCYDILKKWEIPNNLLYNERDFVKRKTIFWRKNEDINIFTYVIISIFAIALMFSVHFVLHFIGFVPASCSLIFVRENGLNFITTLISSTFLIVSFLSFLGDKDDKVLWTDMRSFRLINPPVFNFIGLSVFAFASLAAESISYIFKYDYLFFVSFIAGMFFLIYLTFLVIVSYFRRKETIDKLSEYAISTLFHPENDFEDWQIISDELYENAAKMIEDKNWSKLQEVYNYYIALINGIRNAQIREWISKNESLCKVRASDNYSETFWAFAQRCDFISNPLFSIVNVNNPKTSTEYALFDSNIVIEEFTRLISLLDYRTLKLLINRNKKSATVLSLLDSSTFSHITDESGESIKIQIENICSDIIKKDQDILHTITCDAKEYSTEDDRSQKGSTVGINKKRVFDLELSIGTITLEFPRKKDKIVNKEKTLIHDYMVDLCKTNYKKIVSNINYISEENNNI